jgi:hypothetical protein
MITTVQGGETLCLSQGVPHHELPPVDPARAIWWDNKTLKLADIPGDPGHILRRYPGRKDQARFQEPEKLAMRIERAEAEFDRLRSCGISIPTYDPTEPLKGPVPAEDGFVVYLRTDRLVGVKPNPRDLGHVPLLIELGRAQCAYLKGCLESRDFLYDQVTDLEQYTIGTAWDPALQRQAMQVWYHDLDMRPAQTRLASTLLHGDLIHAAKTSVDWINTLNPQAKEAEVLELQHAAQQLEREILR